MAVPFELRNDFASIALDGERQAGAVRVLDESSKRRRVGLLSQAEADQAQPLLSPLYYIRRALQPFADLVEPSSADLADAIPQILDQKPAMIVMADIGTIPAQVRQRLVDWVDNGGTLVRFAGSRLAAAGNDDDLLPVRLRTGERSLGGALSWTSPQPVTEFAGPCLCADRVTVTRVLRTDARHRRAWAARRRHAAGHRLKKARARWCCSMSRPRTWSNPADLGSFVNAAPHRALSRGVSHAEAPRPSRRYRMISWRAGAADAGCTAAGAGSRAGGDLRTRPAPRPASLPQFARCRKHAGVARPQIFGHIDQYAFDESAT